jgi:hypothetical protein
MRRHKIVSLVILILSIVNFVLAAPAVREIHEARDDVIVRVLAEYVRDVAEKRGNFGGRPLPVEYESEWDSDSDSDSEDGYETSSDEEFGHSSDPSPASTSTEMADRLPSRPTLPSRPKLPPPRTIFSTKAKTIMTVASIFTAAIAGLVVLPYTFPNPNSTVTSS